MNKKKILLDFIKQFLEKDPRIKEEKVPAIWEIQREINKTFASYEANILFEEGKIEGALKKVGYEVFDDSDEVHPVFGKIDENSIFTSAKVKVRRINDLKTSRMRSIPGRLKPETKENIKKIREKLEEFFEENLR